MSEFHIELELLGPVVVRREGTEVSLPQSKKTRALLAYLSVAGRPMTRSHLCELFWEESDDPRGGLRWSLSRLRRAVNTEEVEPLFADRSRVCLNSEKLSVDFLEMRRLLKRPQDAPQEALERIAILGRNTFLEGLDLPDLHGVQSWLIAMRSEARELYRAALVELLERLQDNPEQAIPHALALTESDPRKEAWHCLLVDLLLKVGRTTEAEARFQAGMRELEASNVGTHDLRRAWRTHSASQTTPRASAEESEPERQADEMDMAGIPFVGREENLKKIEELLESVKSGQSASLAVGGDPGIGKTHLLQEVARRAGEQGFRVLRGGCADAAYTVPYLPFIEALDRIACEVTFEPDHIQVPLLARVLPKFAEAHGMQSCFELWRHSLNESQKNVPFSYCSKICTGLIHRPS
jgi:DNA-binding SARP family transcriptional activator